MTDKTPRPAVPGHAAVSSTVPGRPSIATMALSGAGAALAILTIAIAGDLAQAALLIPPFGASCVLAFALPDSPLAQPRNLIGGHVVCCLVGLAMLEAFGAPAWSMAAAVGVSVVAMQATRTVHPPAGATPLVVMLLAPDWSFVLWPVLAGTVLLVVVACVLSGAVSGRRYPDRWW